MAFFLEVSGIPNGAGIRVLMVFHADHATLGLAHTNIKIPGHASFSSAGSCLQWTADGQLLVVTKDAIHILTPENAHDTSHPHLKLADKSIAWAQTIIEFDQINIRKWPDRSQEWGAAALGSLDTGLRAVARSPSKLMAGSGGCVVAVLSSNFDLSLWASSKNRYKGRWNKIQDVTSWLELQLSARSSQSRSEETIQAQVTCIDWSTQADFNVAPAPSLDGSFLVVGTRGGLLIFLRVIGEKDMGWLGSVQVSQSSLTHVAFSSWELAEERKCEIQLAYGTADGEVGVVTITQALEAIPTVSIFGPTYNLTASFGNQTETVTGADKRGLTTLAWIRADKNVIIVYGKPGLVHLWSSKSSPEWSGYRSFRLQTQNTSSGSSCFHPISGLHYVNKEDVLLIALHDGSIHAIQTVSSDPCWPALASDFHSSKLSVLCRSIFERTELEKPTVADRNSIFGFTSFDEHGDFTWIQESCQPGDLSYKYSTRRQTSLIAASFWKYPEIHGLEDELRQVLTTSRAATGYSPVHLLRPFFTRLRHCPELQSRVPALLDSTPESLQGLTGALPTAKATCHDPLDFPSLERNFRESLTNQLFGHNILLRLRIKLYTAEFLGKITANAQIRAECDHAVSKLLFDISKITLQILVRHLNLVFAVLKAEDLAFASRVAEQASLPGRFPELVEEVQQLSDAINNFKCSLDQEHVDKVQELCPACCSEVLMGSATTNGTCANGHQWGRCSITSFLLSTPHLRTCVGCSRKALLPAASSPANVIQPEQARSWVVQAFLEASTWCLLCGNNFACVY